ncbi:hypothetical protein Aperf_G00000014595 [Anoplocephala perfoliata]
MSEIYEIDDDASVVEKPTTFKGKLQKVIKDNRFTIFVLIGVAIGFGIGLGLGALHPSKVAVTWISMLGTLYIRVLQLTVLPVIAANIIIVMAKMSPKKNGKVGLAAAGFVIGFDIISGAIGVIVAVIIRPGASASLSVNTTKEETADDAPVTTSDVFSDLFLNLFPDNVVGLTIYQTKTTRRWPYYPYKNVTEPVEAKLQTTDMIGLIFTTIVFGIAAGAAGEAGRVFVDFFESVGNVVLTLMRWFLVVTPVGVCFMIAGAVVDLEDVAGTFRGLGLFMATVIVGLAIHMILQMILYTIVSYRNPFRLMLIGFKVYFLAFITTSPLIAIPEMLETCDKYGIKKKISRFVIPFSGALKGDASGVFQAVACVFIAQLTGFDLTAGSYVIIALLTGFATLAIPMVPSSSIIIIITILSSLGVSTAEVSLLFAVEWLMDRCRSGSIGLGHLYAAAFTHSIANGKRTEGQNIDDIDDDIDDVYEASQSH